MTASSATLPRQDRCTCKGCGTWWTGPGAVVQLVAHIEEHREICDGGDQR